jgi:hypothetical protein
MQLVHTSISTARGCEYVFDQNTGVKDCADRTTIPHFSPNKEVRQVYLENGTSHQFVRNQKLQPFLRSIQYPRIYMA